MAATNAKGDKPHKLKIKTKDQVVVIAGRDKGSRGEVIGVFPKEDRVLVRGVNIVKKHEKQSAKSEGGIIEKEAPIHISNLAHIDPKTNEPTRIGYKTLDDGRKIRVAKKSGEPIDR